MFSQNTGESGTYSLQDVVNNGPGPEEEVVRSGQPDLDEADEAYQGNEEAHDDVLDAVQTPTVHPPACE